MYLDTELAYGLSPAFRGYEACAWPRPLGHDVSFDRFDSAAPGGGCASDAGLEPRPASRRDLVSARRAEPARGDVTDSPLGPRVDGQAPTSVIHSPQA